MLLFISHACKNSIGRNVTYKFLIKETNTIRSIHTQTNITFSNLRKSQ